MDTHVHPRQQRPEDNRHHYRDHREHPERTPGVLPPRLPAPTHHDSPHSSDSLPNRDHAGVAMLTSALMSRFRPSFRHMYRLRAATETFRLQTTMYSRPRQVGSEIRFG
jgi:hypothetical protein